MPFWKSFVFTKGEVEDADLPLPEHRIFDDNGNVKPSFRVASSLHRGSLSAKKATSAAIKKTGSVMNLVRSRLSGSREPADVVAEEAPTPARASTASSRKSASPRKSATPRKTVSPRKSATPRKTVSPRKSATPRKSQTKSPAVVMPATTSPRASTGRAKSPAPSRPSSEVPAVTTSPTKRKASASPKRRSATTSPKKVKKLHKDGSMIVKRKKMKKSASQKKKSTSPKKKSTSPKKKAASPKKSASPKKMPSLSPSKRAPSQDWTVPELKEYAKENDISLTGMRAKADILNVIEKTN